MNRIEKTVLKLIKENFPDKNLSILELCPGEGELTRTLLEYGYQCIEALDINPQNFKVKEVQCHSGNLGEDLPFEDEKFDLVLAVEGIEHLEDQYHFANECRRIVKNGGGVIITTPNIACFGSRIKFLFTGFYSLCTRPPSEFKKDWVKEHIAPLTFWQLRHILHTNGLKIKELSTDHIRRSSLIGVLFYPFSYLITYLNVTSRKYEITPEHLKTNKEINRQMHKPCIYFGRTLIVVSRKEKNNYIK